MKKSGFWVLMLSVTALKGFAREGEKAVGLNLGYGTDMPGLDTSVQTLAIGARFNYGVTDRIGVSPSLNYFFKKEELGGWEINADAHCLFRDAK